MVLRSQLDAQNDHLPNKTFDVKTRGSIAIRQDRQNYEVRSISVLSRIAADAPFPLQAAAGYSVTKLRGSYNSFEREYYVRLTLFVVSTRYPDPLLSAQDLIRSAFLKYQFQARIGAMDGVIGEPSTLP